MKSQSTSGFKLFGRFLLEKGIITEEDVFFARSLQRKKNRKVGEIAVSMGLMVPEEVEMVLTEQESLGGLFLDLAVDMGIMTIKEKDDILKEQEENHLFFGEALVEIKAITRPVLIQELKAYNLEKLKYLKKVKAGS